MMGGYEESGGSPIILGNSAVNPAYIRFIGLLEVMTS